LENSNAQGSPAWWPLEKALEADIARAIYPILQATSKGGMAKIGKEE